MRLFLIFLMLLSSCVTETNILKYQQDDSETTNDSESHKDSETNDTTINNNVTALFEMGLRQVACPACVGVTEELTLKLEAEFHQQTLSSHFDWIPNVGECESSIYPQNLTVTPMSVGDTITVSGQIYDFSLGSVGNGKYSTSNFYEYQYERQQNYTVATQSPKGEFNFTSLSGFDWIEPYTLLWVDQSYAFDAAIYRTGAEFTWGPSGISDQFMIIIDVFSKDGSQSLGSVTCVGEDSGYLYVPGIYLSYPKNSLTVVYVKRLSMVKVPIQDMGTNVEVLLEWEVVGTGHIE